MSSDKIDRVVMGRSGFIERFGCWSDAQREAAEQVLARVEEQGIHTVRLAMPDLHGIVRAKTVMRQDLAQVFRHGIGATTALYAMDSANNIVLPVFTADGGFGVEHMGGAGDMIYVPDPTTFRVLPWLPGTAWMLGDIWLTIGERVPFDPRRILRQALERLAAAGYHYCAGLEVEFHIFRLVDPLLALADSGPSPAPPVVEAFSHGFQFQSEGHVDEAAGVLELLRENLLALGLPLRTIEDEWGPGQFELTFDPMVGMEAADAMLLFRSATKQLCRRQGLLASFMCKPGLPGVYSSGWHLHQSLLDPATGDNLFAHPEGSDLLSDIGRQAIGGLLEHAAALSVFSNPTVNGYKRLNANPLAPNRALWSYDNKAAYLRLVGGGAEPATHIENRSGEPAANPYLYMASQIEAMLDGLARGLDPGEPRTDPYAQTDKPLLPMSLMEALAAVDGSSLFRRRFGDLFVDYLLKVKRAEVSRFLSHVTDWEHREYFEAF